MLAHGAPAEHVSGPVTAVFVLLVAAAFLRWYVGASRSLGSWPQIRPAAAAGGVLAIVASSIGPLPALAHERFSAHMVQHLLLTHAAAPLLIASAPAVLLLRTSSPARRRRVSALLHAAWARALVHPLVAWPFFAAVMWGTHFSPLYDAALSNEALHGLEHALYLGAALLFWAPVVALRPATVRLSHPARLAYLLAALPTQAFLGLALWSSASVLYPHYLGSGRAAALSDQRAGAVVMWVGGDLLMIAAAALVAVGWMRHDDAEARRADRRLARGSESDELIGRGGREEQSQVVDREAE